ncbi:MAG: alpha/beta hydrolase, partial [Chloroflexota bacterium]
APTATPLFDQSKNSTVETNITYCTIDGINLEMDVYYPQSAEGLWPVAVYVHGGSFVMGNKNSGAGIPFVQPLVEAGYLVVAINYRLAPENPFPAPIEDVKCAIRSLRTNASEYNLDVTRIGVFGGSAGGQLVSMMGVMDASAGFDESGGYLDQSSRVQAVVSMAGLADLSLQCTDERVQIVYAVESCQDTETLARFSPVNFISPDDPPFLLLHGEFDTSVPTIHSVVFYDRLQAKGVPVTFFKVQNAEHVFNPVGEEEMQPNLEELILIVISFFNNVMK